MANRREQGTGLLGEVGGNADVVGNTVPPLPLFLFENRPFPSSMLDRSSRRIHEGLLIINGGWCLLYFAHAARSQGVVSPCAFLPA